MIYCVSSVSFVWLVTCVGLGLVLVVLWLFVICCIGCLIVFLLVDVCWWGCGLLLFLFVVLLTFVVVYYVWFCLVLFSALV